jgi:hypothetical protein
VPAAVSQSTKKCETTGGRGNGFVTRVFNRHNGRLAGVEPAPAGDVPGWLRHRPGASITVAIADLGHPSFVGSV